MTQWKIYDPDEQTPTDTMAAIDRRGAPPPWRDYSARRRRPASDWFQASPEDIEMVNAALHLRRPLLVTGKPGCGKSSLAAAVADKLGLGPVLRWSINTRSTLQEGLYHYDAVGRLQAASLQPTQGRVAPPIGEFLRLGPLGTALLPRARPRVLLIDEIDKSDIDLPNDLLHVFEEGEFDIPEIVRLARAGERVRIRLHGSDEEVELPDGHVQAEAFPVVFMTSNGERDFPQAFMRRCLHLRMQLPSKDTLAKIVSAHLGAEAMENATGLITDFLEARDRDGKTLATDQLLNAVYLVSSGSATNREQLARLLFTDAGASGG